LNHTPHLRNYKHKQYKFTLMVVLIAKFLPSVLKEYRFHLQTTLKTLYSFIFTKYFKPKYLFQSLNTYCVGVCFVGGENGNIGRNPLTNLYTSSCIEYTCPRAGIKLSNFGGILIGICKSTYHFIENTATPLLSISFT